MINNEIIFSFYKNIYLKVFTYKKNIQLNLILTPYKIDLVQFNNLLANLFVKFDKNLLINIRLIFYNNKNYTIILKKFTWLELINLINLTKLSLLILYKLILIRLNQNNIINNKNNIFFEIKNFKNYYKNKIIK